MNNIISQIGNTPLIHLKEVSELTSCNIYGKAEFLNPGLSVKDRAALSIIENAEKRGELKKGGTIVEGTAGNTGIGISYTPLTVGNFYGYAGDGEVYEIVSTTTSTGWSVDLTYMTSFASCAAYCSA